MVLWLAPQPLVLASRSDIRGKILAASGLRFEIRPSQVDERAFEAKSVVSDAAAVARHLARAKADAVAVSLPGRMVLGADQTLARGRKRFSKPATRADAAEQLRTLRGRTHELHSALALVRDGTVLFTCVDTARLTMRNFSDRFLNHYLDMAGDSAMNSVGGYQLEGIGIHLFERVDGDYFTILGLPLLPLLAFLRENGFVDG
ncbi:MAG: Maf family protein [Pseudolabrys sp.]